MKRGKPTENKFADEARFIRRWLENPAATGAVSPSSPFLARAMALKVDPSVPGPIVELGPGTGPVTQALLSRGVAPERLVLVEYDPHFCRLLQRRFPGVRVVQGDAYRLADTLRCALDEPAAAIVSGLPLLNTAEAKRQALLADAFDLMRPDGVFVQFTYGVTSPIPRRTRRGQRMNFEAAASPPIWLNLPPARIWTYRKAESHAASPENSAQIFLKKLRERTDRVRDGLKEQAARFDLRGRDAAQPKRAPAPLTRPRKTLRTPSSWNWPDGPR